MCTQGAVRFHDNHIRRRRSNGEPTRCRPACGQTAHQPRRCRCCSRMQASQSGEHNADYRRGNPFMRHIWLHLSCIAALSNASGSRGGEVRGWCRRVDWMWNNRARVRRCKYRCGGWVQESERAKNERMGKLVQRGA